MRGSRFFVQSLLLAATAGFFSQDGRVRAQPVSEQDVLLGAWQLDLASRGTSPVLHRAARRGPMSATRRA